MRSVLFYSLTKTQEVALFRVLSVDLNFCSAPEDLMTKFVDCLVRLSNLRTLEVFYASRTYSIRREPERECAQFPSVRELWISNWTVNFVESCPNVESIIALHGLAPESTEVLKSYGKKLGKLGRLIGLDAFCVGWGELRDTFSLE